MTPKSVLTEIGIGRSAELNLRVSVAALVRVLFEHPKDGTTMLALERKATVLESEKKHVDVKSQPFGGAMRLLDPGALQQRIGDFHFDSEESRLEQDFRIFIRPADWEAVQEFCLEHLSYPKDVVLEADPSRELTEEFMETLGIHVNPNQYTARVLGIIVEDQPSSTENAHARGFLTARIYLIFEAHILDQALASTMIENSVNCPDQDLREFALQDFQSNGRGRANAVLALPFKEIHASYLAMTPESRETPNYFQDHQLDGTVAAILDVEVPKYQRL